MLPTEAGALQKGLTLGPVGRTYHTVKTTWTDSAGQAGRGVNTGILEDRYRNGGLEPIRQQVELLFCLRSGVLEPRGLNMERFRWVFRGDGSPLRTLAVRANVVENSSPASPKATHAPRPQSRLLTLDES